ncbi:hypothetical protein P7L78_10485 [Tistrella bauzanensis]|uniref:DUF3649 domain-containing protein n=1 Tax=Tistrella arctica TaxID=3133430 RepID=A0ABU9YQU6_9PROT
MAEPVAQRKTGRPAVPALVARITAATGGAWAASYAVTAAAALLLADPIGRPDAVLVATLPAFLLHTVLAVRVFAVATTARAWAEIAAITAAGALIMVLAGSEGTP